MLERAQMSPISHERFAVDVDNVGMPVVATRDHAAGHAPAESLVILHHHQIADAQRRQDATALVVSGLGGLFLRPAGLVRATKHV